MKAFKKYLAAFTLLTIFYSVRPTPAHAQDVSFQVFYDDLSPYGQWVDYPGYGYVWVPSAGPDFTPYSSGGHWIMTDYGWTWVSDYSWGWAPFHYGRWDYDNYYGWVWIPDNEWGPAWVSWRTSPGYYGWAPMGPGVSINVAIGDYNPPPDHWVFVDQHYMGRNDIHNYYGPRNNNQTYINNSTVINNTYIDNSTHNTYVSGPRREEVQKVTGRDYKPVAIKDNSKPGDRVVNNQLNIYRPRVSKGADVKPSKVAGKEEVKPIAERPTTNKANATPANRNATPANGNKARADQPASTTPRATQQRQPQQNNASKQPKQPLNASPAVPRNQTNSQTLRNQTQPAQQPRQQTAPRQQQQPVQQQPVPQQRQQPVQSQPQPRQQAQPPRQQPVEQPRPQPQQQAPRQEPQQQAPRQEPQQQAPAPQPRSAPAPRPR